MDSLPFVFEGYSTKKRHLVTGGFGRIFVSRKGHMSTSRRFGGFVIVIVMVIGYAMKVIGGLGILWGLILTPGFVIFPIIFWIVEGVFPTMYFVVWAVGTIGTFVVVLSGSSIWSPLRSPPTNF